MLLSRGVAGGGTTAREAAKGKNRLLIGADLARQCIEAGLVDEVLVHVRADPPRLTKRPVSEARAVTNLRFDVVKS